MSAISVRLREVSEITPTKVTQGATFDNNEVQYKVVNAVDKDFSTAAIATKSDDGETWIKIELRKTLMVHKIRIYSRFFTNWYYPDSWCAQSVSNFKACVDNDNDVNVSVYQGDVTQKSCGTLKLTYELEQSDQIYTLMCNTEGDTVKLSKTTGNIAVCEVVVIGTGS
jgi:hypothetical protein